MLRNALVLTRRLGLAAMLLFMTLAIVANVSTSPTAEDVAVFENVLGVRKPARPMAYQDELALIWALQARVLALAPAGKGIPDLQSREPADLVRHGQGLCYDRSRTIEKALAYAGFETRHVYLLFRDGETFWPAILRPGHPSHAVTEVKTSRGWLLVDSLAVWAAVTRNGVPVDADRVWARVGEFDSVPDWLRQPWWAVRGLYSRHGRLYPPFVPFPDVNWGDFIAGFFTNRADVKCLSFSSC